MTSNTMNDVDAGYDPADTKEKRSAGLVGLARGLLYGIAPRSGQMGVELVYCV